MPHISLITCLGYALQRLWCCIVKYRSCASLVVHQKGQEDRVDCVLCNPSEISEHFQASLLPVSLDQATKLGHYHAL